MNYFHLLEVFASEVFGANAMGRHARTAHFLSALATLSQALARRQQALAKIEQYRELLERPLDEDLRTILENQQQLVERDQQLAELELGGIDLWINTLSGAIMGKEQLAQALQQLADNVAGATFERILSSDYEMDMVLADLVSGRQPSEEVIAEIDAGG